MKALISLIVGLPIAIFVLALALANNQIVEIAISPFDPILPQKILHAPLYAVIFVSVAAGVLLGGIGTWFGQSRFRHAARQNRREAVRWRQTAETLRATRDADIDPPGLPALPRR